MLDARVDRIELVKALALVKHAAAIKGPMHITTVKIEADGSPWLRLTCTDLEMRITASVKLQPDGEGGAICLDPRRLMGLKYAPDETVHITQINEKSATVETDSVKFTELGYDKNDFPHEYKIADTYNQFTVDAKALVDAIAMVEPCAASDNQRPVLTSIHWTNDRMEAADGFRLACAYLKVDCGSECDFDRMIPVETMRTLVKLLGPKPTCAITVKFTDTAMVFEFLNMVVQTGLIQGMYPGTSSLIPPKNDSAWQMTLPTKAALNALRVIPKTGDRWGDIVRITEYIDGVINFHTHDADTDNDALSRFHAVSVVKTQPVKFALNRKYLEQALQRIEKYAVAFDVYGSSPSFQATFEWSSEGRKLGLYVIMPMFVQW